MSMNNFQRAEAAARVFDDYASNRHSKCFDKVPFVLAALLADLMHFAQAQGVDFESCADWARLRFDHETGANGGEA